MKIILILFSTFLFLGCATYTKSQCENFNWEDVGYKSALRGETQNEATFHFQKTCAKDHQVQLNESQFLQGYQRGLKLFCSPEGGQVIGKKGTIYKGICPKESEEAFLKSYDRGRVDFLTKRVDELEGTVSRLRSDLSRKDSEIFSLESQLNTLQHRTCP